MEAEYISASEAVRELVWLIRLLKELFMGELKKPLFFMDNDSAIKLIKNPEFHKRSKHIDIRYHFIREKYNQNLFILNYVSTHEMIADMFTKALAKDKFQYFRSLTGMTKLE